MVALGGRISREQRERRHKNAARQQVFRTRRKRGLVLVKVEMSRELIGRIAAKGHGRTWRDIEAAADPQQLLADMVLELCEAYISNDKE